MGLLGINIQQWFQEVKTRGKVKRKGELVTNRIYVSQEHAKVVTFRSPVYLQIK